MADRISVGFEIESEDRNSEQHVRESYTRALQPPAWEYDGITGVPSPLKGDSASRRFDGEAR